MMQKGFLLMAKLPASVSCMAVICGAILLAGCATTASKGDPLIATIEISDKPNAHGDLYRYITWNGEDYGPHAFISEAKSAGIRQVKLDSSVTAKDECASALAYAIGAEVNAGPVHGQPSGTSKLSACKLAVNIPHPVLADGEFYTAVTGGKASIEGGPATDFAAFPAYLQSIKAKAIVMRDPTIADAECLGAIANQARVQLREIEPDGRMEDQQITGMGTVDKACSQEN